MKIVVLSDTHSQHLQLEIPKCDILIHCGDISMNGSIEELEMFDEFLFRVPCVNKLVIAGNHDFSLENKKYKIKNATYLCDESVIIDGVKFYGSPWQPCYKNMAFNKTEEELELIWDEIPLDTEVLITHTPPYNTLDINSEGELCGSISLRERIKKLNLKVHLFGHIHESAGISKSEQGHWCYNVAICDKNYLVANDAILFEL